MIRLRPHRVLLALALSLAFLPSAAAPAPTVDDVVAALRANDSTRARALLDDLRSQGLGDTYDVRFLQGVLYLRAGEGEQAARVFDELEASEGPAPELASGRALSAWSAGRYAEARSRLERATRLWPEHAGVWANLGEVYRALATRAYQQVLALRRSADAEAPLSLAASLAAQSGAPASPSSGASAPASPGLSASAVAAADSSATSDPATPGGSTAPTDPAAPTEPAALADSSAPADSSVPADSPAPADPAATSDPATPEGSTAPADPAASSDEAAPLSPPPSAASGPSPGDGQSIPAPSPAPPVSAGCFRAGPWVDAPPPVVLEWLPAHDAQVLSLLSSAPPPYHRVYLGPFENRRQAERKMASLRELGVRDMARITTGPLLNAVSLGVYLKRESVDRRIRALQALATEPRMQAPGAGAWLRGMTSDSQALASEWSRDFPDVPLTPERCPSSSP